MAGGMDQHLEPVIGGGAKGTQNDKERGAGHVVSDLPAADFVEPRNLGQEPGDLGAAVLREELHQRLGQFAAGDRQLLDRA
ncbi:hypothetical protein D3C87_1974060 [compost metagenome]